MVSGAGDDRRGEAEYQLAADMNPYLQEALLGLGKILMNRQQEARALTVVQDAVALNESNWEAQRLLGTLMVLQGDSEAGAAVLEQVLDEDPENAYAHYALGIAYCQLGQYRDAKKELKLFKL
jgi:Flp pilus assembly protein TadD